MSYKVEQLMFFQPNFNETIVYAFHHNLASIENI